METQIILCKNCKQTKEVSLYKKYFCSDSCRNKYYYKLKISKYGKEKMKLYIIYCHKLKSLKDQIIIVKEQLNTIKYKKYSSDYIFYYNKFFKKLTSLNQKMEFLINERNKCIPKK